MFRLGMLEECGNSVRVCLKQIPVLVACHPTAENKLKHLKYLGKLHMQYCAVLSQQSRHGEALDHAKYGTRYVHLVILEVTRLAENYVLQPFSTLSGGTRESEESRQRQNMSSIVSDTEGMPTSAAAGSEGLSLLEGTARKILPILHELSARIAAEGKSARPGQPQLNAKINMKSMFGFMSCSDFVLSLNIGNIMQLSPLSLMDIYSDTEKQLELTRESLLEKAALLAVSYFCLSTEKRFLAQTAGDAGRRAARESEFWHAKALEIACCFLPGECPLVAHIFMSYQKHHSPLQQAIVLSSAGHSPSIARRCRNTDRDRAHKATERGNPAAVPADHSGAERARASLLSYPARRPDLRPRLCVVLSPPVRFRKFLCLDRQHPRSPERGWSIPHPTPCQ